jgi:dihydrofolate reductase
MIPLVLIAAVAENGVIGRDNRLLWRLKSDMRHFRTHTIGKPVIMGRKTYESIGKPLPGRHIIVITRDVAFTAEGVEIAHSLPEARDLGEKAAQTMGADAVYVAGGGEIYAAFLPDASHLEITRVALSPEGDAFFPAIDPALWKETNRADYVKSADDEAAFSFLTYSRR